LCEGYLHPWKIILEEKKVGDGVETMNFVAFGVYSIGFHVSFDFIKMDILFYF
jgi:hypothetical protein